MNSNIDFYKEINDLKYNYNENESCLLTGEKLKENYITLNCNHKFNYLPLYYELCKQKSKNNILETTRLNINQMKCPYCREITNKILPYIICENVELKNGVNYPSKYCLEINHCDWIFKGGKNKNNKCNCSSFFYNNKNYCLKHHKIINKITDINDIDDMTNENIDKYKKQYNIVKLKEILKVNKLKVNGNKNELIIRLLKNNIPI